ncbi:MAG: ABC transporter ATP-binding protein [Candidatus Lokiarchaeota archaeon]|nr:ABC transporter ATP-binding protein [Candidatus Lokiarchaeota archaeon]
MTLSVNQQEFSPEKDEFYKPRKKGAIRWIIAHILKGINKFIFFIIVLCIITSSILSSSVLINVGLAINDFLAGNFATLGFYTLIILILAVSAPLLTLFSSFLREYLAQKMERDVRKEFYASLLGKSQSFHDLQKIGELMARATNDVRMLNYLISPALSLIIDAFTSLIVPLIYIIIYFPPQLLLIITPMFFIIAFLISLRSYSNRLGPVTERLQMDFGKMNAVLNESLAAIEVVKSTTTENYELEKYIKHVKDYKDTYVKEGYIEAKYLPILLLAIAITIGLSQSIFLNIFGLLNIGQIITYIGLLTQLRFPTFISTFVFTMVRLAIAGADRLLEIINKETEISHNAEGIKKQILGNVKFEDVSFIYPNTQKAVLKKISFEVKPGQTIAIVGTTGSGKSTLTKLITRLYDVTSGRILVDDIDVREYALESLRGQISFIEQDIFLFSTSILENITFGKERNLNEVISVAKQAQAHEFITRLPKGYESQAGERGVQLSGGEKQRIAIARSFLVDAPILILDDATAAIDSDTEDKIQRAINSIRRNRTTFLITHRLSQIRWADLIIVLKRGEIVSCGSHAELLKTSEEYKKIFVKKFEVEEEKLC